MKHLKNFKSYSNYFGVLFLALSLNSCSEDDAINGATAQGTITVEDQILSQNTLTVENVEVDADAWLVVRRLNGYGNYSGMLSEPIFLEEGSTSDLRVELGNRDTVYDGRMQLQNGATLIIFLHEDDGDGTFEYDRVLGGEDRLMRDGSGEAISETVKISSVSTTINEGTKMVENRTITIDTVSVNENGWLALHNSNEDGSINENDIVGSTYVSAGENADVEVVLEDDFEFSTGQTLFTRLYRDDPADEVFTFEENPEEDSPFIFGFADNNAVTNSFVIE